MSIYKTPFRSLMCLCIILGLIGLFRQAEAQGVTVTSISPVVGKVGDEVTIVGTNFSTTASENLVDFSGVMGTVTSATATELKVTVPAGALVGPISVTVGGLTAHSPQFFLPSFTGEGGGIATESFGDKFELRVGDADKVSIGDLDGDGKPDLVVADSDNPPRVSVHRNTGSAGAPAFAAPATFTIETGGYASLESMAIGDLNGDGKPDLVITVDQNYGVGKDDSVSVLLNQSSVGNFSFASPMLFGVENDPTSVAIGDLDGDGKPDLAVGNRNRETGFSHLQGPTEDNVVSVLLNQSSGGTLNFADRVEYQVGAGPSSVAIGDLDGDGKHDIAAAEDGTNSVSVLRNQSTEGTLAFAEKATFAVGEDPFPQFWALSVSMGDLDGNGKPDLAVANSRLNRVSVLQNQSSAGSLAFAEHVDLTVGASPSYVSIGDLDGDGKPDLGVTYGNYNWQRTVSLLRNLSNAAGLAFEERVDFEAGWRISSMTIGDLDDDGRPDLAVADDYRASVFRNLQGLTVSSVSPAIAKVGDEVTIEGAKFSTTPAENLVDFGGVMGTVTSATSSELIVEVPMGARFGPISVTVGGRTASSSQFFLPTFAGPGGISTDTFGPAVNFAFGGTPQSVSVGDLDGDGKPDMAVAIQDSNTVAVLRNTSSSGALSQESFDRIGDFAVDTGPNSVSIGDLDGDGKLDLVTTNTGTDIFSLNNTVSVLRNTSGPDDLTFGDKVDFTVGSGPNSVSIGDLDGDGKPDLVVTNLNFFQGTTVSVLRNTSGPDDLTFESKVDFTVGLAPAAVSIGDLDGDGRLDLTVVNLGDNTVSLLRNTTRAGPITFESKVDFTVGSGPGAVSIGDLDGDGKLDLAVVNLSDNTVSLLRNTTSAGTVAFDPKFDLDVGSGPTAVSIGDLDGDGLPDLVVANQEANTVSVLRQTGSGTLAFHPKVDLTAGADPAHVLIGDLDGNDIPDLVVANLESKTVSVVRNLLMSTPGVTTDPETDVNVTVATLNARVRAFGQETTVTFEYGEDTSYGQTVAAEPGTVTGTDETEVTAALSELLPGTEYHYRVMATNGTGTTVGDDRTFNTQERATTGQTADVGTMDATLSASVRGDGEEKTVSFEVGTDTNYGQSVAADPPTVSGTEETTVTASVTGLEPGTQYHVRVKVEGSSGVTYGEDMTFTTEGVSFALSIFPMVAKVGEEVTIAGGDFSTTSPENLVDFSGVEGRVTSATATELVVTVPTGSRFGPISVTVGGLTVTSSAFFLPTFEGGGEITIDDFDTTVDLAVGLRPRSSDLADLDGDGKLDLVIRSDRTVSVLHNTSTTGSLTFDPRADVGEGRSSAIGDLNGDGKPDLVVASSPRRDPDSFVSIFRNGSSTGTITFDTKVSLTSSDELSILEAVSIGDLDGDGRPDLVVVDRRAGVVSVLRNTSSADVLDFQLKVDFGVGEAALDVSIGDLDADGKPDLVVANLRDDTVSLLRNASGVGAITFEPKVDLTVGNGPVSVSIGDLDGDGKLDLAVANLFANTLSVLRNTSSVGSLTKESFDPKVDLTAVSPIFVSIGDLDGDGKPDLARRKSNYQCGIGVAQQEQ